MGAGCSAAFDETLEEDALETADVCANKGSAAREVGALDLALDWYTEALRLRASVKRARDGLNASIRKKQASSNFIVSTTYTENYSSTLVELGALYFAVGKEAESFIYYLHAHQSLDPLMDSLCRAQTTVVQTYAEMSIGLSLVYISTGLRPAPKHKEKWEEEEEREGISCPSTAHHFLRDAEPLELAEHQLKRAIDFVVKGDGHRASILVPLLHLLARVYVLNKSVHNALRSMQWCLGLAVNNYCRASDAPEVAKLTRSVVANLKVEVLRHDAAIRIQRWWATSRVYRTMRSYLAVQRVPKEQSEDAKILFGGGDDDEASEHDREELDEGSTETPGEQEAPAREHNAQKLLQDVFSSYTAEMAAYSMQEELDGDQLFNKEQPPIVPNLAVNGLQQVTITEALGSARGKLRSEGSALAGDGPPGQSPVINMSGSNYLVLQLWDSPTIPVEPGLEHLEHQATADTQPPTAGGGGSSNQGAAPLKSGAQKPGFAAVLANSRSPSPAILLGRETVKSSRVF